MRSATSQPLRLCTQHTWRCEDVMLLTLPTTTGFAERAMRWACTCCPQTMTIVGCIKVGTPVMTPEFWDQAEAAALRQDERQRLAVRSQTT